MKRKNIRSEEMFARGGVKKLTNPSIKEEKKSKLVTIIYSLVIILLLTGVSFALYTYDFVGNLNIIKNETIELEFLESTSDIINMQNVIPISDESGMNQANYFVFQVRTKTKSNISIGYNLKVEKLEAQTGYTQLDDNEVKIYLTDYNDTSLIKPTLISDLDNYVIYKKYHNHDEEKEEQISKYKLRVWIDGNVTGEGWDKDTKIEYRFKIGVGALDKETYKVVFNSNNGKNETKEQYIAYNEALELEKNSFTKEDHKFIGWSLTSTGEVKYQDREKVTNLKEIGEEIDLYAVWQRDVFDVDVVVQNGIVNDEASKRVKEEENITFKLTPNSIDAPGIVNCTNNQEGSVINNQLTVRNVTSDTVCTVVFSKDMTVLYNDGTLIINELAKDRASNITTHGEVTKEYEAMSNSNSYVMASASSQPWVSERASITDVEIGQEIKPVSTAHWFRELRNMETGDFTKLNTSEVTDMQYMFHYSGYSSPTYNLTGLDTWDTSKVTDMRYLFDHAGYTTTTSYDIGDLSRWNTSQVIKMSLMFASTCKNAPVCDIGNIGKWNTSKVTDMSYMFSNAIHKAVAFKIDLSSWDTSSVIDMSYMFYNVGVVATVWNIGDLSKWNTSNVTNMSYMFSYGGRAANIFNIGDLSKWDTSMVTDMSYMFAGAGQHTTTFNSIGILKIPANSNTNMLLYDDKNENVSPKFTGNFIVNGTLSSYTDMLRGAATDSSARINLYYKNAEAEAIVDELISLYGPNGTVSQGNIYKVTE